MPQSSDQFFRDMNALHEAQAAIAQKEARLNFLLRSAPAIIFSCDPDDYRCYYISENVESVVGYPVSAWLADPQFWVNHVHPDDLERVSTQIQQELVTQATSPYQYRLQLADGQYRWFEGQLRLIVDAQGQPLECIGSMVDVHERKMAIDALRTNEALFRLTLDQSQIMVFTQDRDLRYLWVYNPMSGFQVDDFIGKRDEEIFTAAELTTLNQVKQGICQGEPRQICQFSFGDAGKQRYFKLQLEPLTNDQDQIMGIAGVSYEITQEVKRTIALKTATQAAQAASRAKGEFLANMSHELRTPLNSILGLNEALQDGVYGELNSQQQHALRLIENSSRHLLELINDILDLSKIEAGRFELSYDSVNVASLCQSSLAFIRQQAADKRIQVQLSLPDRLPLLCLDERRLRQVLINLLTNAVKFTPEKGQVSLTVSLKSIAPETAGDRASSPQPPAEWRQPSLQQPPLQQPPPTTVPVPSPSFPAPYCNYPPAAPCPDCPLDGIPQVLLCVQVSDTGIGISEEQQQVLFQPFVQIDSSLSRTYEGTGLGLALVKRIVELHNGQVTLTSHLNQGSCFTVEIPCSLSSGQPDPAFLPLDPALLYPPPSFNPGHLSAFQPVAEALPLVLLAEDKESNVVTLAPYLSAKGFRLLIARTGYEVLELVEQYHPDLILMDIQMPDMDGLEATRMLRATPQYANIPIIALTAMAVQGDRERCLAAGVTEYLAKPVSLRELAQKIQHLLSWV